MAKKPKLEEKEYIVTCDITGTCSVYVTATSEEAAREKVESGEGTCEIGDWSQSCILDVTLND